MDVGNLYKKGAGKQKTTTISPISTTITMESGEYDYEYSEEHSQDSDHDYSESSSDQKGKQYPDNVINKQYDHEDKSLEEEDLIPDRGGGENSLENEIDVARKSYLWKIKGWTDCSVTCGEGMSMTLHFTYSYCKFTMFVHKHINYIAKQNTHTKVMHMSM